MSKIEVLSAVHGIAPRSDELLRLGTDVERGRASEADFAALRDQETSNWLALQHQAGIDIQEDGKLSWQDHLRPIVKATSGFADDIDAAPLVRWFEDNRFYRQPKIIDELQFDSRRFATEFGRPGPNVSLIDPLTFAKLCSASEGISDKIKNIYVGELYDQLFDYFDRAGVQRVTLIDYAEPEIEDFLRTPGIDNAFRLGANHPQIQISYVSPRKHVIPKNWPRNVSLSVENSTIQTLQRRGALIPVGVGGHEIWQFPIDATTTRTDAVEAEDWPYFAYKYRGPARLVLTHSTDFELLPLPVAQDKLKRLGELAAEVQAHLEVERD